MRASPIDPWRDVFTERIQRQAQRIDVRIEADWHGLTDRSGSVALDEAGLQSANGACRLLKAADTWVAVNLPRESDWQLVPAWTGMSCAPGEWGQVARHVAQTSSDSLLEEARLFGLAVAILGETVATQEPTIWHGIGTAKPRPERSLPLKVVDLSSLWAGPLCGAVLAAAGAHVTKIESTARPDSTARSAPAFDRMLNGAKTREQIDFSARSEMDDLARKVAAADVVITSARPRAFEALGLMPERLFALNPSLIWVAITAHGWQGETSDRVGFGDDAAVAGGLIAWQANEPRFLGDAIADPLTGLAAAEAALATHADGGGGLIDAALSRVAAWCAGQRASA